MIGDGRVEVASDWLRLRGTEIVNHVKQVREIGMVRLVLELQEASKLE